MLTFIFSLLIIISIAAAIASGNVRELTEAVLNEPVNAVELCIYLCGGMCFWGGLMRVAESSGLTERLAAVFSLILGGLFRDIDKQGRAFKAICMNITANLLGLGNAATPFGIEAMKALAEEEGAKDTATPSMVIFTVINTASLTLIPSTALSLRMKFGSADPIEIVPAVWITSAAALAVSVTAAVLPLLGERKREESL
ncbi:MAG: nucleoside recognition domain-containing protein [Huintestinicola sp.]|uniref:nucleoside recognition domain-containing protein n=1 Tax=Huintestinicola sp. TaxID=2981661 RepID=UPI003F0457E3